MLIYYEPKIKFSEVCKVIEAAATDKEQEPKFLYFILIQLVINILFKVSAIDIEKCRHGSFNDRYIFSCSFNCLFLFCP